MLETLLTGGLLGSLGAIATNVTDYFKQKQINKHELEMKHLDLEAMDKEFRYKERSAELEADTKLTESADDLQEASYTHDARAYSLGYKPSRVGKVALVFVDVIRGLVRPVLTCYLIYCVMEARMEAQAILNQSEVNLTSEQALGIYKEIIEMILFLSSTAAVWWFGSRGKVKKGS